MKSESNQFLSLEQMLHLISLGIDVSKASVSVGFITEQQCDNYYSNHSYNVSVVNHYDAEGNSLNEQDQFQARYKTLTLQDMLEMMPEEIERNGAKGYLCVSPHHLQYKAFKEFEGFSMVGMCYPTFLENAYYMLIWLAENNLIQNNLKYTSKFQYKEGDIITIYQQEGIIAEVERAINSPFGTIIIAKNALYDENDMESFYYLKDDDHSIYYYVKKCDYRMLSSNDDIIDRTFLISDDSSSILSDSAKQKILRAALELKDETLQKIRASILRLVTIQTCLFDDEITPTHILKKDLRLSDNDLWEISKKIKEVFHYNIDYSIVRQCTTVKDIMDYVEKFYKSC